MPANLTPEYKDAEKRYRQASTPEEQAEALREMLATIPKHKGTEKLQADLKKRLSQLRKESDRAPATARQRPDWVIEYEGAGQVPVLGPPNAGKSALIAALTGAPVEVADYPYTTQRPAPAMMPVGDAQVQLIDVPPASEEYAPDWLSELVRRADAVLLVADLGAPDGWKAIDHVVELLAERRLELVPGRVEEDEAAGSDGREGDARRADDPEEEEASLTFRIPAIVVGTKADEAGAGEAARELLARFEERFPVSITSARQERGLEDLRRATFRALRVIRVYSREPGKPHEREKPWVLPEGSTVLDLARTIHKDLAERFEYGRLWGSSRFEGQRVGEGYVLADGDEVEIHAA